MILVRPEHDDDLAVIEQVILQAFANQTHSNQQEHLLIRALRKAGALSVSLVAETDRKVVGYIGFSEVTINHKRCGWFGLGPLAVLPDKQKLGIGVELARRGLDELRKIGAQGCVVLGDPAFYRRFGFAVQDGLVLEGVPKEYFQVMRLGSGKLPQGIVLYHQAFMDFA